MDSRFKNSYLSAEWQRKKNAVLERDNYTCQICGDSVSVMHVHHITYKNCKGLAYNSPMGDLITLCEKCHKHDDGDHKHFFNGKYIIHPGYSKPLVESFEWPKAREKEELPFEPQPAIFLRSRKNPEMLIKVDLSKLNQPQRIKVRINDNHQQ